MIKLFTLLFFNEGNKEVKLLFPSNPYKICFSLNLLNIKRQGNNYVWLIVTLGAWNFAKQWREMYLISVTHVSLPQSNLELIKKILSCMRRRKLGWTERVWDIVLGACRNINSSVVGDTRHCIMIISRWETFETKQGWGKMIIHDSNCRLRWFLFPLVICNVRTIYVWSWWRYESDESELCAVSEHV